MKKHRQLHVSLWAGPFYPFFGRLVNSFGGADCADIHPPPPGGACFDSRSFLLSQVAHETAAIDS